MYLDPVAHAHAEDAAEDAREKRAADAHKAARSELIEALLKNSETNLWQRSYATGEYVRYSANQHFFDEAGASAELRRDVCSLIAMCERSADHGLRLLAQSILSRAAEGYAECYFEDYEADE